MADKLLEFDLHFEEHLLCYDNAFAYYRECLVARYSLDELDLASREYLKARQNFIDYVRSLVN